MDSFNGIAKIVGLEDLWKETKGSPEVCVAVLDGPINLDHSSLAAANVTQIDTLVGKLPPIGPATQHGTHVASVIFGQNQDAVSGIAPHCRGVSVPVFGDGQGQAIAPCSQVDLARAILQATEQGAHIINISGGQLSETGEAHPLLAEAIQKCSQQQVLIVAAAGNDGCPCLHVPGASPSVLAVGAMDDEGEPLEFSNWGERYETHGILAPGAGIVGASPQGGTVAMTGTSYATPVVSGVAALLLSLQLKHRQTLNVSSVRAALLKSAMGCDEQPTANCKRLLMGRLNVKGAMFNITGEVRTMTESIESGKDSEVRTTYSDNMAESDAEAASAPIVAAADAGAGPVEPESSAAITAASSGETMGPGASSSQAQADHGGVRAATCECGGGGPVQLVFALGQLGFDYGTEARRDSIMQQMKPPANVDDPNQLLSYLEENPADSAAIHWTLNLDATSIYAVHGQGAFAAETYLRLREFLAGQNRGEVERVSIPGYIAGSATLFSGQVVPVIWPVLRGMYSWNTTALVEAVCGIPPSGRAPQKEKEMYTKKTLGIANFLLRVYDELRNLGFAAQERAINYTATNAFQIAGVFEGVIKEGMDLDTIAVERSPLCRPNSDCWDVKLTFFNPSKVFEQAKKVYRFTVDVSDVVPVMVGPVRSWFVR